MLTPHEEELKAAYIAARGYWKPWTEGLLRLSPAFLQRYAEYGGYPAAHGPLSPLMCELLYVALDASGTHLFEPGLKLHLTIALQRGATSAQLVQVLQLGAAQGLEGTAMGIEILLEELQAAGQTPPGPTTPDPAQQTLRAEWEARFGDWPRYCQLMLTMDPGYLRTVLNMLTATPPGPGLTDLETALISLGLSACFTANNPAATRLHIRRALRLGAEPNAIMQVLQMTAHLGVHACSVGVPALMEALDARSSAA